MRSASITSPDETVTEVLQCIEDDVRGMLGLPWTLAAIQRRTEGLRGMRLEVSTIAMKHRLPQGANVGL